MVQATRWRQDAFLQPTNPYQRVRFAPTFPSGSGNADSAFAWSPISTADAIRSGGSPNGWSPASGLSRARRPGEWHVPSNLMGLFGPLDTGGIIKGLAAIGGVALGFWLARKNLEG